MPLLRIGVTSISDIAERVLGGGIVVEAILSLLGLALGRERPGFLTGRVGAGPLRVRRVVVVPPPREPVRRPAPVPPPREPVRKRALTPKAARPRARPRRRRRGRRGSG